METVNRRKHNGHAALRRGRVSLARQIYHLTVTTKGRARIFDSFDAACAASRCFGDSRLLGDATLITWVLMPDHAHWLLQLGERDSLATIVTTLKSASARAVNSALDRRGALWSCAFHDHALRNDECVETVARYIVANPVRAGLVKRTGDYPFWNATFL